jgi:sulfite exporter TauE/SafE
MHADLTALLVTAASIGFLHTVIGPDHYLPFIALSQSGRWSPRKTAVVTFLCGVGHVLSSVVLGLVGIALGVAVTRLTRIEALRGSIAAWALIGFGLVYCAWGLRRAYRSRRHEHQHAHGNEGVHSHSHDHTHSHLHVHPGSSSGSTTPWVLFTIFVFGPCEPLIPLVMYPAAKGNTAGVAFVAGAFGLVTIATMLTIVLVSTFSLKLVPAARLERYNHALAGASIFLCGVAIQFLHL